MKRNIIICCMATVCVLSLNSCSELMQVTNYVASEWVNTMNTERSYVNMSGDTVKYKLATPENTLLAQAWQSGNGGKIMAGADMLTAIVGDASGKDVSAVRGIIRGSMNDIVNDPNASKSDKANLVGAALYGLSNTGTHFANKNFEKEVAAFIESYTDPESPLYDPYFDCRYVIDYDKKSIRKQDDYKELAECIRSIDKAKYESELEEILQENYGMSYKEYSELPVAERPSLADIVSKSEGTIFENNVEVPEYEAVQSSEIEDKLVTQAAQTQSAEERKIALEKVTTTKINGYAFDETALSESQKSGLDKIAETLNRYSDVKVQIIGHTCEIGYKGINLKKGLKRAEAGKEYLVEKGISQERIFVDSKGETEPLVPNTSGENRKQNRRIEFVVE